ncbi:Hypothetical predicted protein [Mytilus galloprovincialis]|uniref:Peptidase A2 domain-containing protein n=1 Tax=Mytilus galloprovincialis TaxID=29158 RepID=A0A8B6EAY8_MYTGA|nr:Hypothetical predicted protein [Mytilus galloprovincialis]
MGQAQAVLGDLPSEKRQNFSDLVSALEERFAPSSQTELYRVQFKDRRPIGLRLAVELEAYNKAENKVREGRGYLRQTMNDDELGREEKITKSDSPTKDIASWMQTMEKSLSTLTTEMSKLKTSDIPKVRGQIRVVTIVANLVIWQETVAYLEEIKTIIMEILSKGDGSVKILMKTRKQNNHKTNEGAVTTAFEDAGMYVKLNVGDIEAKFVVDTGATLTLVSSKLYDTLTPLNKSYLSEVKTTVKSVCGNKLELHGKGRFNLHFGTNRLQSETVVTDLQVDGILGLDFMKRHNCLIV